jgi:hypothetical protein
MKPGQILEDFEQGPVRVMVMRGPSSLCAYVGIPENHPLAGKDYRDLDIRCHGGLTFGCAGGQVENDVYPAGYWWYGWDYAHYGDAVVYDTFHNWDEHEWTVEEVKYEAIDVAKQFISLMEQVENIGDPTFSADEWEKLKRLKENNQ